MDENASKKIPYIIWTASLMILIASILFLAMAYRSCPNSKPEATVSTTALQEGKQASFQELMEKSRKMESAKINYSVSVNLLSSVNINIPVFYTKYGDDSKVVSSFSIFGMNSIVASYWVNNKSITCSEDSAGKIDCSTGGGSSGYTSEFSSMPDVNKMEKLDAELLEKSQVMERSCSLFKVNMTSLLNQMNQTMLSSSSLLGDTLSNMTYLICLDDEYGFPSQMVFKTVTYSKLADMTTETTFLNVTLTGFTSNARKDEAMPLKEVDFILNYAECEGKNITLNLSFIGDLRPSSLSINASDYQYGEYNETTEEYDESYYKTVEYALVEIPRNAPDPYIVEYKGKNNLSGMDLEICSKTHCESDYCNYDYSYYDYYDYYDENESDEYNSYYDNYGYYTNYNNYNYDDYWNSEDDNSSGAYILPIDLSGNSSLLNLSAFDWGDENLSITLLINNKTVFEY